MLNFVKHQFQGIFYEAYLNKPVSRKRFAKTECKKNAFKSITILVLTFLFGLFIINFYTNAKLFGEISGNIVKIQQDKTHLYLIPVDITEEEETTEDENHFPDDSFYRLLSWIDPAPNQPNCFIRNSYISNHSSQTNLPVFILFRNLRI